MLCLREQRDTAGGFPGLQRFLLAVVALAVVATAPEARGAVARLVPAAAFASPARNAPSSSSSAAEAKGSSLPERERLLSRLRRNEERWLGAPARGAGSGGSGDGDGSSSDSGSSRSDSSDSSSSGSSSGSFRDHFVTTLGHALVVRDAADSGGVPTIAGELEHDDYGLRSLSAGAGDVLLDLGTNVGMTAILLAKMFPLARVVGIEPMPRNLGFARHNAAANNVSGRVEVLFAALTARGERKTLFYNTRNSGGSGAFPNLAERARGNVFVDFELETLTLAELLVAAGVDVQDVRFVKLDCEGCEYEVVPALQREPARGAAAQPGRRARRHGDARQRAAAQRERVGRRRGARQRGQERGRLVASWLVRADAACARGPRTPVIAGLCRRAWLQPGCPAPLQGLRRGAATGARRVR